MLIADPVFLPTQIRAGDPINTDLIYLVRTKGAEVKAIVTYIEQCGLWGKLKASKIRTGGRENVIGRSLPSAQRPPPRRPMRRSNLPFAS